MTGTCLIRAVVSVSIFVAAICFSSLPARAQDDGDTPPAQQRPTLTIGRSLSLGEQIARLGPRVRAMMPALTNEMMRLKGWIGYWSFIAMLVITLGSALREWHENNGEGRNLFWWFGRFAVCLMLWGSGVAIIDQLYGVGKTIAEGNENIAYDLSPDNIDRPAGVSRLYEFYLAQQESFNQSYNKMLDGQFTVKADQDEFAVQPIDSAEKVLGVIKDQGSAIKDFQNDLSKSSYSLPFMFGLMNFARGVMEIGDVWLTVLGGLLLMAFKLLAPLMIAFAIDRKLSQRAVHAYVWGLIVVTLFWPSVSYFLRALAYLAGNTSMAIWDDAQVYAWNPTTMSVLRDPLAQPVVTIAFSALLMLGAGLALIVSPYFAYAFSMGRVFETVSQYATSTATSLMGLAAEAWSASIGARISRHAEGLLIEGTYASERERIEGERRSADRGVDARRLQALSSIKGDQVEKLGSIFAGADKEIALAEAGRDLQLNSLQYQTDQSKANLGAQLRKDLSENEVSRKQQDDSLYAGAVGKWWDIGGSTVSRAGSDIGRYLERSGGGAAQVGGALKAIPDPRAQAAGAVAEGAGQISGAAGLAINIGSDVVGGGIQAYGAWDQYKRQSAAVNEAAQKRESVIKDYYRDTERALDTYNTKAQDAQWQYADTSIAAINNYASRAAAAANAGARIRLGGVNSGAAMEKEANLLRYNAQIKAAEITRREGLKAADLRLQAQIWNQLSGRIIRDIEKNMEMRF